MPSANFKTGSGGVNLIFSQVEAVTVSNTVAETSLLTGTGFGSLVIPANSLSVGDLLRFECLMSGAAVGMDAFELNLKGGATVLVGPIGNTAANWFLRFMLAVRAIGAAGELVSTGDNSGTSLGVAPNVASVDLTADLTLDLTAEWNAADPGNICTIQSAFLEKMTI